MNLTRFLFCVLASIGIAAGLLIPVAAQENTLQSQIDARNRELEEINREIQQTQSKLQETQSQKRTLSSEVKQINTNVGQIERSIKTSEISVEKLGLEIQSLQGDIGNAEQDLVVKEAAVGQLLRQIQQQDAESVLFVLLKNNALSDSLLELQALRDVYSTLLVRIDELNAAKTRLEGALTDTSVKKQSQTIESQNLRNRKIIAEELREDKEDFLAEVKNKEQTYTKYIDELTDRQVKIAQEIADIESRLMSKIDFKNLPARLLGLFETPVPRGSYRITQEYGATAFARRMYKNGFHNGIDFGAPVGTPVYAAEGGVVIAAANQDRYCWKGAYGKFVVVRHYMGLTTLYAHMSLYTVKEGDTVKRGDIIGYVGTSGLATGPHLHYTVYDTSTFYIDGSRSCGPVMPFGGSIDPRNYTVI